MVGLLMGQTAENLAFRFGITRSEMDEFSAKSHQRVLAAQKDGHFTGEIAPLFDGEGNLYEKDDGVREDSTPANLGKLKPFFDRKFGNVTAGNSSQITDGGVWLVLASEAAVKRYDLPVLGRIIDVEWAALDPSQMGLGPVHSATPLMKRHGLGLNDLDLDGLAWLWFDKAGESTNTFSSDAMDELRRVLGELTAAPPDQRPKGLVILSAKDSGFIAGADVHEFMTITSPDDAIRLVRR